MYRDCVRAFSPEAHLSGFPLLKNKTTKEDSNILKKSPQTALQVGGKCKMLVAPVPTPEGVHPGIPVCTPLGHLKAHDPS